MKTRVRNYFASALLLLPAAVTLTAVPQTVLAQAATPEVRQLNVTADGRLEPGTLLTFTLQGTPRAQASVRIRGLRESVPLTEVERGIYVGRYTIKRGDRIEPDADVRATMDNGNRSVAADYQLAEILPRSRDPFGPARAAEPRIERFGIAPLERIEPGAEIRFALQGTPGGTVVVDLPGVSNDLALREVRPGSYEGSYTIRRADNFNPNRPVTATLRIGDRITSTNVPFAQARAALDNRPPTLVSLSPREGETVPAGSPVQIGAVFDDGPGTGVDPASVQITLSGRNVTREAQINRQSVGFRTVLPPGRHTVEVTARDLAGNVVRRNWSFDAAAAVAGPLPLPPPLPVPIPILSSLAPQVLNHHPNGAIGPDPVLVRGRTAPFALVSVNVRAVPPPPPAAGLLRTVFAQTLQADREGIFSFTMVPGTPFPGERYDIILVARSANLSQESRFSLLQQQQQQQ